MASLFEAYITNLGKYNEGELVGETLKFPTTTEEVQALLKRIGVDGVRYEEFFITSFDGDVLGLYDYLSEYENLDELNYLASKLDDMSQDEYERFQAAMEIGDHTGSIQELINLTENLDCYDIYPDIHDHDDLGRYYIEELDAMQVPEHMRNYIDYEAYGRDIALEESGQFTDLGYVRDTGDSFHEYYDGERGSTLGETQILDGLVRDGAHDACALGGLDGHMTVHGALLHGRDRSGDLVAGRDALDALGAGGEHHVAGLDDGHGVGALFEA